jgi:hypothetical protein
LLAEAIFYEALPFSLTESVSFKRFIAFIAPGFIMACQQTIAGPCLEKGYKATEQAVTTKLQAALQVTLGCDGSADGCKEPITHVIAIAPDCLPFLLREVPYYVEEHTHENISAVLNEDIAALEKVWLSISM